MPASEDNQEDLDQGMSLRECVEDVYGEDNIDTSYESSLKGESMKYQIPSQLTNFDYGQSEIEKGAAVVQSLDSAACPIPDEHTDHEDGVEDQPTALMRHLTATTNLRRKHWIINL